MDSLYNIKLDIDKENYGLINDIIRIITIQIITQLLFSINNNNVSFFNTTFLKTVIFLCIGILIYWLIIRKLVRFTLKSEDDK